ncbi:sigma-54-dependent Fis family transcriptional regulator [Rhodobacteraceae bacterium NNCM2]|nr:sigma-54-dependent Fis family transcriptional regulator [Coraliihabitans acroporae]
MNRTILIADDDASQRRFLAAILSASGYKIEQAAGGTAAVEFLLSPDGDDISLMLLDLNMPDVDGIAVLKRLRASMNATPVLVLTSDGSLNRAVEAMQAGASDFLVKPVQPERLEVSIQNALSISDLSSEVRRLSREGENRLSFDELIAISPATRKSIALARRASRSDIPVLIEGESGTGKEVFARAIHGSSDRAGAPFVAVNCGALPANLVESILFGHEKGAFTGATSQRIGKFQEADGGTLFLDEIGELPLDAQVKLLRVLQTGEVEPVGGRSPVRVDFRLISATNRDLRSMIANDRFREDLYYRLGVFPLVLPPLRERKEDLPALAQMFLKRFAATEVSPAERFSHAALSTIVNASWPGNVRQLENTIHRAVVMCDGSRIEPDDLQGIDRATNELACAYAEDDDADLDRVDPFVCDDGHIRRLIEIEADAISRALTLYRGRMSETARRLGIGRSTLYRKIDELRIDKDAS